MTAPPLSVVVASHGRPGALRRCLLALSQSAGASPEAVVVADKAGLEAVADLPFAARLKTVLQAVPNLARARNDGIAHAAGQIVGFLDDDAVPEPTWAQHMAGAFAARPGLAAATGPVVGRNGISLQWGPMAVDAQGRDIALEDAAARIPPGAVRKLHGTNMVIRRDALLSVGGFDPAFRFYLDDTDVALRLAAAGHGTAWVPDALVHHAFAASVRRDADRTPLSLHDIGASTAVFLRRHAPGEMEDALSRLADDQRARVFRLARRRRLGPREIERLMTSLHEGIAEGRVRHEAPPVIADRRGTFSPIRTADPPTDAVLAGWRWQGVRLRDAARRLTNGGARVTVFVLEPTIRAHRVRYSEEGWWEHTGGIYGRSDRDMPRIQAWRAESRLSDEIRRIAATRFVDDPSVRFRNP